MLAAGHCFKTHHENRLMGDWMIAGILPNMKMAKLIEGTPLDTGDAKITKPKA